MRGRLTLAVLAAAATGAIACGTPGAPASEGDEARVRGSLTYEAIVPRFDDRGVHLDQVRTLPAVGLLALVVDGDGSIIGAGHLEEGGRFDIPVATPGNGDERIVFSTLWIPSLEAGRVGFAVLQAQADEPAPAHAYPWAWSAGVPTDGDVGDLIITEPQGSGALYLFLFTSAAMQTVLADLCGGDETCLRPLAVVWSPGATWDCGACFSPRVSQRVGSGDDLVLGQSILVDGGPDGASAWGFAVILHEFGHYVAANYSRDDSPGGPHGFGQLMPPPFAWSEGWASFYAVSAFSRFGDAPFPVFWDIQGGNFLWVDYDSATGFGGDLVRPDPGGGLDQDLDESYVASMLWHLWSGQDGGAALGTGKVLAAVSSTRFREVDRGALGADFVDFVDAVLCAEPGLEGTLPRAVHEVLGFPYDGQPACR